MPDRRTFLSYIPALTISGALLAIEAPANARQPEKGVGAIETLMRGHGLLSRAMLVYDDIRHKISKEQAVDPSLILRTAEVFQDYLEAFHEKAEEAHIFAPMEKAKIAFASIQELKIQHGSGYELTQRIIALSKSGKQSSDLARYLDDFNGMYRHHTAWEDTVVFPAFDSMETTHDLAELINAFAEDEKKALGNNGFQSFVNKIADVEKQLGIFDLSTSTPTL
jgi:hemerythrin-like domain-containing protein